jgi:hypothetical protein
MWSLDTLPTILLLSAQGTGQQIKVSGGVAIKPNLLTFTLKEKREGEVLHFLVWELVELRRFLPSPDLHDATETKRALLPETRLVA